MSSLLCTSRTISSCSSFKPASTLKWIRYASSLPHIVRPTRRELDAGELGSRNLEVTVRSLHEDGIVVVSDVIPSAHLDHLNAKMVEDARILQARGKDGPFNYNVGNIQQDPPPVPSFFHRSIFLNSIASQITSGVLGPLPRWTFSSGNAALPPLPGAKPQRQPVHADADFEHQSHPFALVVNVPLIDFTPENGSTEVWLGTHTGEHSGLRVQEGAHGERASGRIREELLEQRRKVVAPTQPNISKGSIVIRDLRLWHAGMPNHTKDIRVMLAMIHFATWYRNPMKLELADSLKPLIEQQSALEVPVDWVSEQQATDRYLNKGFGNAYDFNQTP